MQEKIQLKKNNLIMPHFHWKVYVLPLTAGWCFSLLSFSAHLKSPSKTHIVTELLQFHKEMQEIMQGLHATWPNSLVSPGNLRKPFRQFENVVLLASKLHRRSASFREQTRTWDSDNLTSIQRTPLKCCLEPLQLSRSQCLFLKPFQMCAMWQLKKLLL